MNEIGAFCTYNKKKNTYKLFQNVSKSNWHLIVIETKKNYVPIETDLLSEIDLLFCHDKTFLFIHNCLI